MMRRLGFCWIGILIATLLQCDLAFGYRSDGDFFGGMMASFFVFLFILIIIFLICREIVCWYFKINERKAILLQILHHLERTGNPSFAAAANSSSSYSFKPVKKTTVCGKCKKTYEGDLAGQFCEECGAQLREVYTSSSADPSSPKFCNTCGQADAYRDANGDMYCPNCRKIVR